MKLTTKQKMQIEQLYERESLTDNLTDTDAQALLKWAEQQILSSRPAELVTAAVSAANASGEQGAQQLVTQAASFLSKQLAARGMAAAPEGTGSTLTSSSPESSPAESTTDHSSPSEPQSRTIRARPASRRKKK